MDTACIPSSLSISAVSSLFTFPNFSSQSRLLLFLGPSLNLNFLLQSFTKSEAHSCLQSLGVTRHRRHCSSLICRRELLSAGHGAVRTQRRHRCSHLVTSRRSILPPPLLFGSWAANSSLLFVLVVAVTSVQPPPLLSPSVSPSFLSAIVLLRCCINTSTLTVAAAACS